MKTIFSLAALLMLLHWQADAQATFPKVWESKFPFKADYLRYTTLDAAYVIGSTTTEICVLDGANGNLLWRKTFVDLTGVKKSKQQEILDEAGMILLVAEKSGNDVVFCLDIKTGNKIWENTNYNGIDIGNISYLGEVNSFMIVMKKGLMFIDAKTGNEKSYVEGIAGVPGRWVFNNKERMIYIFCYQVNALKAIASGLKNYLLCVDMDKMALRWKTEVQGVVEIKKYASATFSPVNWAVGGIEKGIGSGSVLVDLYTYNDKVFLVCNGLKVYNRSSGNLLWKVDYDLSLNRGLGGSTQVYGAVAAPFFTADAVYLTSFASVGRDKSLIKYDMETGTIIWESSVDGRKVIMPNISLVDGIVVVQIGGYVNLQGEQKSSTGTTYFSKWEWEGPFGLKGFDAQTGKQVFATEKFKGRITNIDIIANKLFVADEANLYHIDLKSGAPLYTLAVAKLKMGKPNFIETTNNKLLVFAENGLIATDASGAVQYSVVAKVLDANASEQYDNIYFLKSDANINAIDINTGKSIGTYKYAKGFRYGIKENGKTFMMTGEKVIRYKVG